MPRLVGELIKAWLARERSLSGAVSDWVADRTRTSLLASFVTFIVHSIGGYVVVHILLKGLNAVVSLWRASPRPYSLALLVIQAAIALYVAAKIGTITEQLSDIRTMMQTRQATVTGDTASTTEPRQERAREGNE